MVVAGAEGGGAEALTLSGMVPFSRLEFWGWSRALPKSEFTCVKAVLPQGNSASVVEDKKDEYELKHRCRHIQQRLHQKRSRYFLGGS